jgi:hypothetical protein
MTVTWSASFFNLAGTGHPPTWRVTRPIPEQKQICLSLGVARGSVVGIYRSPKFKFRGFRACAIGIRRCNSYDPLGRIPIGPEVDFHPGVPVGQGVR